MATDQGCLRSASPFRAAKIPGQHAPQSSAAPPTYDTMLPSCRPSVEHRERPRVQVSSPPSEPSAKPDTTCMSADWTAAARWGRNVSHRAPAPLSRPPCRRGLTTRERQILGLVAKGLTNLAIAERLGLSGKTVANYVSVILAKIDATDRNDAARKVIGAR